MSEQKLVTQPEPSRPLLPKQPEVNIGTSGHVDHGKCIGRNEYAVVNGQPMTGYELDQLVAKKGRLAASVDGGEFYFFDDNTVVSVDERFQPVESKATLYRERYSGEMVKVKTATGRRILVTPNHPLLINRAGAVIWMPSGKLTEGDHLAILRTVPLPEDAAFREPLDQMKQEFDVVTWEDYRQLEFLTNDFLHLEALGGEQVDQLRILAGLSVSSLCNQAKISSYTYARLVHDLRVSSASRTKVTCFLQKQETQQLAQGQFLVRTKRGRYPPKKLRTLDVDAD